MSAKTRIEKLEQGVSAGNRVDVVARIIEARRRHRDDPAGCEARFRESAEGLPPAGGLALRMWEARRRVLGMGEAMGGA